MFGIKFILPKKAWINFSRCYFYLLIFSSLLNLLHCETYNFYENQDKLGFAYEFKIHVDAGSEECFYQLVQAQSTLYVAFQVMRGGDNKAGFGIRNPNGQILLPYKWQEATEFDEQTVPFGGYYQFCIDNSLSRFAPKLVSLYVTSYKRDQWEKYMEEFTAADVTVSNFTNSLKNVDQNIGSMLKSLDHSRRHMVHDWYLLEDNNRYIQYWSLAQCIVIIAASYLQVHVVKKFFDVDNVLGKGKPRA